MAAPAIPRWRGYVPRRRELLNKIEPTWSGPAEQNLKGGEAQCGIKKRIDSLNSRCAPRVGTERENFENLRSLDRRKSHFRGLWYIGLFCCNNDKSTNYWAATSICPPPLWNFRGSPQRSRDNRTIFIDFHFRCCAKKEGGGDCSPLPLSSLDRWYVNRALGNGYIWLGTAAHATSRTALGLALTLSEKILGIWNP